MTLILNVSIINLRPMKPKSVRPIFIASLLVVVILSILSFVILRPKNADISSLSGFSLDKKPAGLAAIPNTLVKAPIPHLVLPQGKQEFTIMSGQGNIPKGTKIVADPLDSPKGTEQTIDFTLTSPADVDSVNLKVDTDNQSKTYPMTLKSGDNKDGTWTATWTMADSHENNFAMYFIINYQGKTQTVPFAIR